MMKRALVSNCGLFFTGYNAGVTAELCRHLGAAYFDEHFVSSGSVFGSVFYVANQPDTMLKIWRHYVCDGQLIHWSKRLRGRKILDLDGLIAVFQSPTGWLDIEAISASASRVSCVLTRYETGHAFYAQIKPDNIWTMMRATCAMSLVYGKVLTPYGWMVDGGLSVACPVKRALEDGFDEVVVVYNKPKGYVCSSLESATCLVGGLLMPAHLRRLLETFESRRIEMEQTLFHDPRVKLIRPQKPLPLRHMADGDKSRLNATIDCGIADTQAFLAQASL